MQIKVSPATYFPLKSPVRARARYCLRTLSLSRVSLESLDPLSLSKSRGREFPLQSFKHRMSAANFK